MGWTFIYSAATRTLTLSPAAFEGPETYTATVTTAVKGADGSALQGPFAWSFTTKEAPSGSVSIKGADEYTNATGVPLTITYNALAWKYRVCAVEDPDDPPDFVGDTGWELVTDSDSITLPGADGVKKVYIQFMDASNNRTPVAALSDTITLDVTKPVVDAGALGWLNAANPARTTAATAADATSGIASIAWTGAGLTFSNATILNPTISASADNTYTATLTVTDRAGNSDAKTLSVRRDVTPPSVSAGTLPWLNIANPSLAANATAGDTGSDPSGIVSRVSSGTGLTFSDAAAEDPTISASADGTYTATLRVADLAGNQASSTLAVCRDRVAPTASSLSINSGNPLATNSLAVTLYPTATDATSGVSQMQFSNDGGGTWSTYTYATSRSNWPLTAGADGPRTVTMRVIDAAGNISATTRADSITLDTVAPSVTLFTIGSGNPSNTNSTAATLYVTASDATSGLKESRCGNAGETYTSWESTTAASWTRAWTLPDAKGTRTVYLQVRDNAGNVRQVTDTIVMNARIVVTYTALQITNDSDLTGAGEIYYAFLIDGVQKLVRTKANAVSITSPATFTGKGTGLPISFTIYENPTSGSFTMTGGVCGR